MFNYNYNDVYIYNYTYNLNYNFTVTSSSGLYVAFPYVSIARFLTSSENRLYSSLSGVRRVIVIKASYAFFAFSFRSGGSWLRYQGLSNSSLLPKHTAPHTITTSEDQKDNIHRKIELLWDEIKRA